LFNETFSENFLSVSVLSINPRDYRIRIERAEAIYRQAKVEYERISAVNKLEDTR
jgi:hypothetical protein